MQPVQEIIAQALAIEAEEAGALGYMARAMVQATMGQLAVTQVPEQ